MRNLLVKIKYDGSAYHGWQIQDNALTVQEVFQKALYTVLGSKPEERPDIKACSRTDTGVHAREFCISFKTESKIEAERMVGALNHYLPDDVAAFSCEEVPEDFHARYSCKGKEYHYEIWNSRIREPFLVNRALHYWYKMDEKLLGRAAEAYIGTHDFSSFCTLDRREKGDLTRTVTKAEVRRDGEKIIFEVAADGFLYNMVRIMVGTLLRVQEGRIKPEEIGVIIGSKNRALAGPTAPPHGLYLNKVFY